VSATGRRLRLVATAVAAGLLLAGSLWGSDDSFPFGPFRMFATSGRATGEVRVAELLAVTEDGRAIPVLPGDVGLRRAELEGQYRRFRDDPALLASLADRYRTDGTPIAELRLQERVRPVVDRRPTGEEEVRVLATWRTDS
jgi:hypothetical protein